VSEGSSSKTAGVVLLVAALAGVIAISVFSPAGSATSSAAPRLAAPNSGAVAVAPATGDSAEVFIVPSTVPTIEHIESPFSSAGTDSVAALCAANVTQLNAANGGDSSGVEIGERYGVHPIPGQGRDSLIVDGTARGRDATPAVWHCASTTTVEERHGVSRVVIEDGWPGVPARFQSAHPITVAAEDLCLQRTKVIFPESDFRSVKRWRLADTLHVTGETMPLDNGELSGDFHCRAVIRKGAIVSVVSKAGVD
jgi:hypothetical protein